jgi:hypothetical protein
MSESEFVSRSPAWGWWPSGGVVEVLGEGLVDPLSEADAEAGVDWLTDQVVADHAARVVEQQNLARWLTEAVASTAPLGPIPRGPRPTGGRSPP